MFGKKQKNDYDLAIIGGGSAAFAAAIKAAEADAKVLVIEKDTIGGTCVNRGCVPSKNILHAAELYHHYRHSNFPGLPKGDDPADFAEIFRQKEELVNDLRKAKYLDILEAFPSVEFINESAKFVDDSTIQVNGQQVRAGMFLIATGSSPAIPPIPGLETTDYITYREALSPQRRPNTLTIIGGGPIGLELGQVYARFGTEVTVIEAMPSLIPGHEPEIAEGIKNYLGSEGITFHIGSKVVSVEKLKNGSRIIIEATGGERHTIETEQLLVATGTAPNTGDLDAVGAGVALGPKGEVIVNANMRTANKKVYAAGDVTGLSMLVTAAAQQGGIAVENGLLGRREKFDRNNIPHAVFTTPQVASVGLKEKDAKAAGIKTVSAVLDFKHVPRAAAVRDTRGVLKLVVNEKSAQIIGMHAACPQAAELIHTGLFIIKYGVTIGDILRTTFVYPTMSEAIKIAAISLKKDVTKLSCCAS